MPGHPLPDVYSFAFRPVHLVTFTDSEGIEEGLEIAGLYIDPVNGERMHVELGQPGLLLVADVLCPDGRV